MRESLLRKIVFLFLLTTIISILWAIGANARKKVEVVKSSGLNLNLEQLRRANTVLTNNVKQANNKLSGLKKAQQALEKKISDIENNHAPLREALKKAENENAGLQAKLKAAQKETGNLKTINNTLGEEIIKLKKENSVLSGEIKQLKTMLEGLKTEKSRKGRKQSQSQNEAKKTDNSQLPANKNNFAW
ncbi:MAG: hypothetical protein KJ893_05805 [Candidatus Omnitrophica bacterium]|nr:hypothetical protein [Candidatus Omnitrophota bacterium]MBU4479111.1 hypothetical protein [Candidatus Omnitrophota bacterium]MCG2703412.1 hypothetical protein [Candidatus Omnitrophota bacterium]